MNTKHTAGQWEFGKFNNFEYFDIDCNGNRICSIYCGIDTPEDFQEEAEANAKLIAAAPMLLEALQELKAMALQWSSKGLTPTIFKAEQAIQKATL